MSSESLTQQLQMLLALDHARDSILHTEDPEVMFRAILKLLKTQFSADACAILLIDEAGREVDLLVTLGASEQQALPLCWQAVQLIHPAPLPEVAWTHTLGLRVSLNDHALGSIILSRQAHPFSADDKHLLTIAESQIDSAVIQARMIWKLTQRNRELEAIYDINRMDDSNTGEDDLINGFTSILVEYFQADLCMVIISHIDTGEMLIRGVVGKHNFPLNTLNEIRDLAAIIQVPQIIPSPDDATALILLAAPFIVAGVKIGAIVVGRQRGFTHADQRLIYAMMTQMDSAIVHNRVMQQLNQRNKELEVIYRIDHIRDDEKDFDAMLQKTLREICRSVSSEMGFLMLYNEKGKALELKASTIDGLSSSPVYYEIISRYALQGLRTGQMVYSNRVEGPIRSIIAIPLILNAKIIGVFGTVNSTNSRGFNAEDRRMLQAITSQVDTAVFEGLERRRLRTLMSRSVDPKVIEYLLRHGGENILSGDRVNISVIFADLRGSTEWTQRTAPEALVQTLNRFLGRMTEVIFANGGTLDKFVGDQVIALFGAPVIIEDHAERAVRTAFAMRSAHLDLQTDLRVHGIELPSLGIGVSTGEVIAGEIGSAVRSDFTAIGGTMNLAARLCNFAQSEDIYISENTYEAVKHLIEAEPAESVALKGLGEVRTYQLIKIRGT
ncbi:MAG: GAF domain-containing protein [Anaerolineae bacterium]|nr:GAF domain-containing protein [Anaerolineae bacterium]